MSDKKKANQLDGSTWLKNSFSIWRNIPKDSDNRSHPAPFPVKLARKIIECFASDDTGVVLDPFAGSGSTMLAALLANMQTVGLDINPEWRALFEHRLTKMEIESNTWKYEIRDAQRLADIVEPGSIELCMTSPPYWDIQKRRRSVDGKRSRPYSGNAEDLGNRSDYGEYLHSFGVVASQVETALREGGYFIVNVMDIRKGPTFYPLHMDIALTVKDYTVFSLDDIIIWDRQADYNSMRPLGYPYKFIINKVHEYLLVFRRQNASRTTLMDTRPIGRGFGIPI